MSIRLNKLLAERGLGARRKCDELIASGVVKVNGVVVTELGTRVEPERDRVEVRGRLIPQAQRPIVYMLHKPVGVISTLSDPEGRRTLAEFMPPGARLFPVGRLDADTSGLLLLTNDGELAHKLMHPRYGVAKFYRVHADRAPSPATVERMQQGVEIEPGIVSAPAQVRVLDETPGESVIEITIHEGRYRQVRRMCEAVGLQVHRLHRWAYGPLRLGEMQRGMWRELSDDEVASLREASARPRGRGAALVPPRPRRPRGSGAVMRDADPRERGTREFRGGDRPPRAPDRGERPARRPDRAEERPARGFVPPPARSSGASSDRGRGAASSPNRSDTARPLARSPRPLARSPRPARGSARGDDARKGRRGAARNPRPERWVRPGTEPRRPFARGTGSGGESRRSSERSPSPGAPRRASFTRDQRPGSNPRRSFERRPRAEAPPRIERGPRTGGPTRSSFEGGPRTDAPERRPFERGSRGDRPFERGSRSGGSFERGSRGGSFERGPRGDRPFERGSRSSGPSRPSFDRGPRAGSPSSRPAFDRGSRRGAPPRRSFDRGPGAEAPSRRALDRRPRAESGPGRTLQRGRKPGSPTRGFGTPGPRSRFAGRPASDGGPPRGGPPRGQTARRAGAGRSSGRPSGPPRGRTSGGQSRRRGPGPGRSR